MASKDTAPEITPQAATIPWWKEPTRDQWMTLLATWGGWCLDVFDYFLLALVLTEVTKTFGVSLIAIGTVLTATLISRLVGGVIVGTWGDRVGRKLPLMVSILTFAVFSAMSGFAPNFKWFFLCRI
jgi:MFS family permease